MWIEKQDTSQIKRPGMGECGVSFYDKNFVTGLVLLNATYAYIMFSSATQPPPRHNFVVSRVSAITFEGFKLRSSNLTHALLIQISRTSSIIDMVFPSKMAADGHSVKKKKKKKVAYRSEMARNAIQNYLRTS